MSLPEIIIIVNIKQSDGISAIVFFSTSTKLI